MVALVLQANPALGWRDVQEVLIASATQVDASDPEWRTNQAGYRFSPWYGAGLVHAGRAVSCALAWTPLPPRRTVLAAADPAAAAPASLATSSGAVRLRFVAVDALARVEHVEVEVDIRHPRRHELSIVLISPHGTESRLAQPSDADPYWTRDYIDWTFSSIFHCGERAGWVWTIDVEDSLGGTDSPGEVRNVVIRLHVADACPEPSPPAEPPPPPPTAPLPVEPPPPPSPPLPVEPLAQQTSQLAQPPPPQSPPPPVQPPPVQPPPPTPPTPTPPPPTPPTPQPPPSPRLPQPLHPPTQSQNKAQPMRVALSALAALLVLGALAQPILAAATTISHRLCRSA